MTLKLWVIVAVTWVLVTAVSILLGELLDWLCE